MIVCVRGGGVGECSNYVPTHFSVCLFVCARVALCCCIGCWYCRCERAFAVTSRLTLCTVCALRQDACDKHGAGLYKALKAECDEYFKLKHRNATRGIGGIFFDAVRDDTTPKCDDPFAFVTDCTVGALAPMRTVYRRICGHLFRFAGPWSGVRVRPWAVLGAPSYASRPSPLATNQPLCPVLS
jgi:hypothetical protein